MPVNVGGYEITKEMENSYSQIVKSGLVLHLDAGISDSYPGSGTTWYDLSPSGLEFTSQGTTTPYEIKNNVPSLAFNSSGYWRCNTNIDMAAEFTLIMLIYSENLSERDTIFEKAGTAYNSYEQEIAVTYETDEALSFYSRRSTYDFGSTNSMNIGSWNMMAIKLSSGKIDGVARNGYYSKNGSNFIENYTPRSTNAIVPAGEMRIGTGYAGTVENGNISSVLIYDRMITDDEIFQIYNILKNRYGI